ncbi:DUF1189 family protein [Bacillus sp. B1-b2]|uniref:DUF1189 family protein n=1 Tax=Bacillus sp. B1-b2 TaxID=2653201 RepID=UPI001261662E|nr:DUF1189 family protein [Bacillus sp. B1-b2]KAB7670685.1 DUF1189 domain-containing protein [Bacillus sp. B1-b2]
MKKSEPFLMQYFRSIITPTNAFKGKSLLTWPKMFILFIFLIACMMMPTSIQMAKLTIFPFEFLFPNTSSLITDDFAQELSSKTIKDGKLVGLSEEFVEKNEENVIAVDVDNTFKKVGTDQKISVEGYKNAIIFKEDYALIAEDNGFGFQLFYPTNEEKYPFEIENKEDVMQYIGSIWYQQNKAMLLPILLSLIAGLYVAMNILQFLFMACVLWLTKRSNITHIRTFKEASNIVLNAAGLPTIVAVIYGFIQFDVATLIMIQSLGTVLMIAFAFFRTGFKERDY